MLSIVTITNHKVSPTELPGVPSLQRVLLRVEMIPFQNFHLFRKVKSIKKGWIDIKYLKVCGCNISLIELEGLNISVTVSVARSVFEFCEVSVISRTGQMKYNSKRTLLLPKYIFISIIPGRLQKVCLLIFLNRNRGQHLSQVHPHARRG